MNPLRTSAAAALSAAAVLVAAPATDAATSLSAKLSDFKVTPAKSSVTHGRVTFRVKNSAGMEHELVVIKTSKKAANLPTSSSGKASEKGSVGEVELAGGKTKSLTLNLKKGHYALICNIGGHYKAGMHADLTVK
ncbi:plastocyanin/azurin family copper-binding protein [Baekduia sp. Peel2402]|uniref:plastocyanin/azurin family copper-binding protein n=1 Tax=Baekduia sp. Peel2402 TaxID=3458296 RepID=UPI00403E425F